MQDTSLLERRMRATKGKHTLDRLRQQFCTVQNIVVVLFFRNYGVFRTIFFASPSRINPDNTRNNSVARTEGERSKSTSSGLLFTSGFPVDRLRTCFLLSDVAGKNSPPEDVRGRVKRAAIIQLGTEGHQQGVGLVSLFSSCVCRWDVAEFRWLDSHFSGLQRGSVRRLPDTLWGLVVETRLSDRPHVGAGVGVPLRDSAALPTRSRRRFAAPAA